MAVQRMQKVFIFSLANQKEELLNRLQELGMFQIKIKEEEEVNEEGKFTENLLRRYDRFIERVLSYLCPEDRAILEGKKKLEIDITEYEKIINQFSPDYFLKEGEKALQEIDELNSSLSHLKGKKDILYPYRKIKIPLNVIRNFKRVKVFLGSIPLDFYPNLELALSSLPEVVIEEHQKGSKEIHLLIACPREKEEETAKLLNSLNFTLQEIKEYEGTPKDEFIRIEKEISKLKERKKEQDAKIEELVKRRFKEILVLHHFIYQRNRILKAYCGITHPSTHTIYLEGWVRFKDLKRMEEEISKDIRTIYILPTRPDKEEIPPVDFVNREVVQSFEPLIDLYGRPNYKEIDPTPYLAPFFALFFGLCLTDAGYGFLLFITSTLIKRIWKMEEVNKRFLNLMQLSGMVTIIVGMLTGSYFGLNISELKGGGIVNLLKSIKLFDPLQDIMIFLGLALILGITHISLGFLINMGNEIRGGWGIRAVLKNLPWVIATQSLGILMISFIIKIPPWLLSYNNYGLLVGIIGIFFFNGVQKENLLERFAAGISGIYGISGIFSDLLSYSRLLALGLATAVIAGVINILAGMLIKIPLVGIFLMVLLLVLGHSAYVLISALSAGVHTLRLNFVEFFGKFYEGGGEKFNPLSSEGKYVVIRQV